ncbi:MAG: hypothetical protein LBP76_15235 [Treponema sp.]|jgi:phosphoribosyl 1,2-cyclic phosphate phosphodiesterase|nr:hypothetical protein [Treponema sp.]
MRLLYLGTGAADAIPAFFCSCPVCSNAVKRKGKDIRSRSQSLVDGKLLLDFPPDTFAHYVQNDDFDLPSIRHLLITHSHWDHFFPAELEFRFKSFVSEDLPPLHLYGNEAVEKLFFAAIPSSYHIEECFVFHRLSPFRTVDIEGYAVTPLLAKHAPEEECLLYLITQGGKTLLYAHDTGIFPEETWKYLEQAKPRLNILSLDCTQGKNRDGKNHMGLEDNAELCRRLGAAGALSPETVIVLNHIAHSGGLNHEELCKEAEKHHFIAAYDGFAVSV